jgi:transposase
LQDPTGFKQGVKKMKLGAIFYLKQLGFNQYNISTMIDIKRPTVQSSISRVNQTGATLTGKSTGRPSAFDDYTQRHLERTIRRDPFQLETITGQLRMMGKNVSRSTTRKWVSKLGFRYYTPAVKPKMNKEHKKID